MKIYIWNFSVAQKLWILELFLQNFLLHRHILHEYFHTYEISPPPFFERYLRPWCHGVKIVYPVNRFTGWVVYVVYLDCPVSNFGQFSWIQNLSDSQLFPAELCILGMSFKWKIEKSSKVYLTRIQFSCTSCMH